MEEGGKMCCWQEMFVFVSAQLQYDDNIKQESVERRGFGDYQYMITIQKKRCKGDNTKTGKKHFCRRDNEDHAHGTWLHFKSSSFRGGFDDEIIV